MTDSEYTPAPRDSDYSRRGSLSSNPQLLVCPVCQNTGVTVTVYKAGVCVWASCIVSAVLCCCWLGCCLIPFCCKPCMDCHHYCSKCNSPIGKRSIL
mmetsp:Transcript_11428/g.22415  ORF Transcript_11428/g.22415 Transcript_11428/m.22415 type:complete len:97 (-) Transcript_11428:333-623(-)